MDIFINLFSTIMLAVTSIFSTPDMPSGVDTPLATTTAEVIEVLDGDTIVVNINGKEEFVRYIGVDTPEYIDEKPDCFAEEATAANQALVAGKEVLLVADQADRDKYNRLLRYVYIDKEFVNAKLIENGVARSVYYYPNGAHISELKNLEVEARAEKRGLWGVCRDAIEEESDKLEVI